MLLVVHTGATNMRTTSKALGLVIGLMCATAAASDAAALPGAGDVVARADDDLRELAALATSGDPTVAAGARARLRAAGPAGLRAFVDLHAAELARADAPAPSGLARLLGLSPGTAATRVPLLAALDEICGQRDCAAAQLYWYTDLEQAKAAARASGRPILSLRLLGALTDELSCANSRFFRALLYPDPAVAALLREQFVLHWQTERPAPRITIDFGDGRSIETTITGNSAHYVLDGAGRPVDVLPGMLAPAAFVDGLHRAAALARASGPLTGEPRAELLRRHHRERVAALDRAWTDELQLAGRPPAPRRAGPAPRAGEAAPIAVSKMAVERPMLERSGEPVDAPTDAALWDRLADRHAAGVRLSAPSFALLQQQQWRSGDPARDAADLAAALVALRRSVALDTLRNEYELHRRIHEWFVASPDTALEALNQRVYGELFLTPRSDPWLGLADPAIYSGLSGGGRRVDARI
jgi:hypothetical protein